MASKNYVFKDGKIVRAHWPKDSRVIVRKRAWRWEVGIKTSDPSIEPVIVYKFLRYSEAAKEARRLAYHIWVWDEMP